MMNTAQETEMAGDPLIHLIQTFITVSSFGLKCSGLENNAGIMKMGVWREISDVTAFYILGN